MQLDSRWTLENHLDSGGVHLEYVGQGKVLPDMTMTCNNDVMTTHDNDDVMLMQDNNG